MAFQPVPDSLMIVMTLDTWDNQEVVNVWYSEIGVTPFDQTVADALGGVMSNIYDNIKDVVFSGNTWRQPVITDVRSSTGPQLTSANAGFPKPGTSGADPLPGQNAALISWKTDLRGPAYRGRTYFGGLTEAAITSGVASASLAADLNLLINDVVAVEGLKIVSRIEDGGQRDPALATVITSGIAHNAIATQRRRSILS